MGDTLRVGSGYTLQVVVSPLALIITLVVTVFGSNGDGLRLWCWSTLILLQCMNNEKTCLMPSW